MPLEFFRKCPGAFLRNHSHDIAGCCQIGRELLIQFAEVLFFLIGDLPGRLLHEIKS